MDPLEKLKQEEAELEAQMLGNPTQPEPEEDPDVAATDEGIQQSEEELEAAEFMEQTIVAPQDQDEPEDQEEPEPPQKPKRTNWKKRFTNYKSSTDATIYGLRQELMDTKSMLSDAMARLQNLQEAKREEQGDLFEGAFTQEDEDTFGTEGLDVVKKAAKVAIERQVKPLQEELRREQRTRVEDMQRRTQADRNHQYQEFLSRLETLVPDFRTLDSDKGFVEWLKQGDTYSPHQRRTLLRQAEAAGDVARVADFFTEYKESLRAVTDASNVPEAVRKHVTPVGSGGGGAAPKQKTPDQGLYRKSDIDKFYSDLLKGRYEGKQDVINATEAAIERAYAERRVLHNQ